MDEELEAIKNMAGSATYLHRLATVVVKLCDYIAELEKELADLETRISDMEDLKETLMALED